MDEPGSDSFGRRIRQQYWSQFRPVTPVSPCLSSREEVLASTCETCRFTPVPFALSLQTLMEAAWPNTE